jgi:2-keto-4-pentenoate hydratase
MNSLAEARPLTERLLQARVHPDGQLDLSSYPISRFEALALQLEVADRYADQGDPIGGWKVAYTSGAQRDRFGEGYRAFGFIPRSRVLRPGAQLQLTSLRRPGIEVELCLRTTGERGAVEVAPAFELIERRVSADADPATIVADGCSNWGIVVGDFVALPERPLVELEARMVADGVEVARCRPGDSMDDPLLSLSRLQALLGEYGRELAPGQCVITGSLTKRAIDGPGRWTGAVQELGEVELTIV